MRELGGLQSLLVAEQAVLVVAIIDVDSMVTSSQIHDRSHLQHEYSGIELRRNVQHGYSQWQVSLIYNKMVTPLSSGRLVGLPVYHVERGIHDLPVWGKTSSVMKT